MTVYSCTHDSTLVSCKRFIGRRRRLGKINQLYNRLLQYTYRIRGVYTYCVYIYTYITVPTWRKKEIKTILEIVEGYEREDHVVVDNEIRVKRGGGYDLLSSIVSVCVCVSARESFRVPRK